MQLVASIAVRLLQDPDDVHVVTARAYKYMYDHVLMITITLECHHACSVLLMSTA
jgi:hypothetical protein